jgi:hypothetical protein
LVFTQSAPGQAVTQPTTLPIYRVLKTGATAVEAAALAKQLGIPSQNVLSPGGAIQFVDTSRYLSLPTETAPNSALLEQAIAATRNKDSSRKITATILNAAAVSRLPAIAAQVALTKTAAALQAARLTPQFGTASVGHHELSLFSSSGGQNLIPENSPIDTEVTYRFTDPNGYPIYGPGAEVQVTFDGSGNVSRVLYATRTLQAAGTVAIIPQGQINQEIARQFPANSIVNSRLVYFAPPLSNPQLSAATLIPWYAYTVTTLVTNQATGVAAEVKSKIRFLPATADIRFVPTVRFSAQGGRLVNAAVSVQGGTPPYHYIWGGSNPAVSATDAAVVSYTPQLRVAQPLLSNPAFSLQRNESLSVTVVDANGISVFANGTVPVEATPVFPQARDINQPTFGSENPGYPLNWVPTEVAWNTEMGKLGAGATLSFNWLGDNAWPGDYIRPFPAGTLVSTPWIYGDADFANWGVDAADIVLDNADGNADGKAAMAPGLLPTQYNTAAGAGLTSPAFVDTVNIGAASYGVSYNGSWGPVGPNDTLEWLLLDDCDMLDAKDGGGLNVVQRWGPAFGGLHVLTGFASLDYGNGPFEGGVADNVLGITGPAQSIVQSWFNSASATSAGNAAAMGPAVEIMPGVFICDADDHFWGKGTVGPTLVPSSYPPAIFAYWYLTSTSPLQYLF